MICKNCGNELDDGAVFCCNCGTKCEEERTQLYTKMFLKDSFAENAEQD
ncbi:MAG: hypothetical protein K2O29_05350 [Ruminococcus sp.]|nr:hypothetical protein [Ruminococcus sp.]MDE6849318.1 hypothetical protein [Ruminococcus sp.]MDE7137867.1 hypothetical protein [Ruminococcus sp.]